MSRSSEICGSGRQLPRQQVLREYLDIISNLNYQLNENTGYIDASPIYGMILLLAKLRQFCKQNKHNIFWYHNSDKAGCHRLMAANLQLGLPNCAHFELLQPNLFSILFMIKVPDQNMN